MHHAKRMYNYILYVLFTVRRMRNFAKPWKMRSPQDGSSCGGERPPARKKIEKMLKRYIVSKLQEQHTRSSAIKKRRLFDRHAIIAIQLFNATVKMHFDFWNINYVAYRIEGPRIISNGSVAFELASTRSRTIQFHDLNEHHFLKRK